MSDQERKNMKAMMKNCHKWYTCLYKKGGTPEEVYSSDIKNILGHQTGVWDRTNRGGLGTEQMAKKNWNVTAPELVPKQ